jgi:hypothetical protein
VGLSRAGGGTLVAGVSPGWEHPATETELQLFRRWFETVRQEELPNTFTETALLVLSLFHFETLWRFRLWPKILKSPLTQRCLNGAAQCSQNPALVRI